MAIEQNGGVTVITGEDIPRFQKIVVCSAMTLYINTGMKANRAYTPTNMLAFATQCTGKTFKKGKNGLIAAYNAMREQFPDLNLKALNDPKPFPNGK